MTAKCSLVVHFVLRLSATQRLTLTADCA
jgi:hypothetical protein